MKRIPFLRDIQYEQTLDYPTIEVNIDREKAGLSGVKVEDVGRGLVMATSSTRFLTPNYWVNAALDSITWSRSWCLPRG